MPSYRIAEAAELLGVSDDTMRRWIDLGRITAHADGGRQVVDGEELAALAVALAEDARRDAPRADVVSARNRFPGIVVAVKKDAVMAQVEMICGPHRVVSLLSSDAVEDLGLAPGVRAIASIKSTNVVLERP